jgi:hypothetical protein
MKFALMETVVLNRDLPEHGLLTSGAAQAMATARS